MYKYTMKLRFSKIKNSLNFEICKPLIQEAVDNVNMGMTFKRDNKKFYLEEVSENYLLLVLLSKDCLVNPKRSVSAITRYLTTYHFEIVKNAIFNKTIFNIELISTERKPLTENTIEDITNEDVLKSIIDLFYNFSSKETIDSINRENAIKSIKTIMLPYINK